MPRGGKRTGTPGKPYANRSDLREAKPAVAEFRGQPYGQRQAQVEAQRAVPAQAPPGPNPAAAMPAPAGPAPGSLGPLDAETARPDQPITDGLDIGAGRGSEALTMGTASGLPQLRAIYQANPTEDLRSLIEFMETSGG